MKSARIALVPVLAALVAGLAGAAPATPETSARALVVAVAVPGQDGGGSVSLEAPPGSETIMPTFVFPEDGSVVRIGAGKASAAALPGASASAQAVAEAQGISLFGGEIVADVVSARATTAAGAASVSADTGSSTVSGLVALGQPVSPTPGLEVPLADWGTLQILAGTSETEQEPVRQGDAAMTALRVTLGAAHGPLPAGAEIVIGIAEAKAGVPLPATDEVPPVKKVRPKPKLPRVETVRPPKEPGHSVPGTPGELVRPVPEGIAPRLSTAGYVFPVWGPVAFGDTFGAFRGDVAGKWHHGEDIVAPLGAPLLAVADGTLFSVGWNDVGGWRLWLRDGQGNQFYYAHLSAYSALAVEGATVKAGQVIGFVGTTGDAEGGPPHLHFEIHPVSMLGLDYDGVIAPYPYLLAWRRAQDVSFDAGRRYLPDGSLPGGRGAPPAGAILLEAEDISATSGLVPGALEKAFAGGG